jgi:hypothetical protein
VREALDATRRNSWHQRFYDLAEARGYPPPVVDRALRLLR